MNLNKFTTFFDTNIRLSYDEISVSLSNIDELMTIWMFVSQEPRELVSCRPIIKRNYNEQKKFYMKLLENGNISFFSIFLKDEIIGKINLVDYNVRNRSVEIGYLLLPQFRKKGYMTIAMRLLCDYLFLNLNINKIYAQTGEFNISSIHLLESLDFSRDAVLREHHELDDHLYDDYIYSLLASEYYENK